MDIFVTFLYQPLLNVLVFFYWILGLLTPGDAKPDMGIAVILLTLLVRVILLPLSLAGDETAEERREISRKVKELEEKYAADPIYQQAERKKILQTHQKVVISELITFAIQTIISIMLWRIFAYGLTGQDLHLLYSFMPKVELPFNLLFLGKYDLTHPHVILNVIQSLLIFILETVNIYTSGHPYTRNEAVRLQLVLPLVSFLIFMFLPAGKKLFVITALVFSIFFDLYKGIRRKFQEHQDKLAEEAAAAEAAAHHTEPALAPGAPGTTTTTTTVVTTPAPAHSAAPNAHHPVEKILVQVK